MSMQSNMFPVRFSRREYLKVALGGLGLGLGSGWLGSLAAHAAQDPGRKRSCILLWMSGGPSQLDTFDPKPGTDNGGPFKAIETSAPGLHISEHLPKLARWGDRLVPVRSMSTKEGDHQRATFLARTGYLSTGPIRYPSIGALLSKELGREIPQLPNFISIAPYRAINPMAFGPGFLGPAYAPLVVGEGNQPQPGQGGYQANMQVKNLQLPPGVNKDQAQARLGLLEAMESRFLKTRPDVPAKSHKSAYDAAVRMMRGDASKIFDLSTEPEAVRERYGDSAFGHGCLLARRLVERGVPFVEVSLTSVAGAGTLGWDTHANNFESVESLCGVLDSGWAALMQDLKDRDLLDSTLIVWMGEFGRTPTINDNNGRDHFPTAWTTVLAGGGVKGGQPFGRTSDDGTSVVDRPVKIPDLLATVSLALGVDPDTQNLSNIGRPIGIVDPEADPMTDIVA